MSDITEEIKGSAEQNAFDAEALEEAAENYGFAFGFVVLTLITGSICMFLSVEFDGYAEFGLRLFGAVVIVVSVLGIFGALFGFVGMMFGSFIEQMQRPDRAMKEPGES